MLYSLSLSFGLSMHLRITPWVLLQPSQPHLKQGDVAPRMILQPLHIRMQAQASVCATLVSSKNAWSAVSFGKQMSAGWLTCLRGIDSTAFSAAATAARLSS